MRKKQSCEKKLSKGEKPNSPST